MPTFIIRGSKECILSKPCTAQFSSALFSGKKNSSFICSAQGQELHPCVQFNTEASPSVCPEWSPDLELTIIRILWTFSPSQSPTYTVLLLGSSLHLWKILWNFIFTPSTGSLAGAQSHQQEGSTFLVSMYKNSYRQATSKLLWKSCLWKAGTVCVDQVSDTKSSSQVFATS